MAPTSPIEPPRLSRLERLLQAMRPIYRHDLPNQLVIIQGLIQLLEMDEKDRLSEQGRDYLTRLSRVSRKALDMSRFLKEMTRLMTIDERASPIELPRFMEEVRAEARLLWPEVRFELSSDFEVDTVVGWPRLLNLALGEITRGVIACCPRGVYPLQWITRRLSEGVELRLVYNLGSFPCDRLLDVSERPGDDSKDPMRDLASLDRSAAHPALVSPQAQNWQERLEFALVREMVAAWDGSFTLEVDSAHGVFAFFFPQRSFHG